MLEKYCYWIDKYIHWLFILCKVFSDYYFYLVRFMKTPSIIVLDIGGSKINAGIFKGGKIVQSKIHKFNSKLSSDDILAYIISCINEIKDHDVVGIAIGVPSIVDLEQGIIIDAVNIKAWKHMPLKASLEQHFNLPVYINNDVNCFTFGEHLSGAGKGYSDIVGICIGTGIGSALVFNNDLYTGHNCSAGEIGCINYLSGTFDEYCGGVFFTEHYGKSGSQLFQQAIKGDTFAIEAFETYGQHLGEAISQLLLFFDPKLIVIGGSITESFDFFIGTVWEKLANFPYQNVIKNLHIEKSRQQDSALLGAANLYLNSAISKDIAAVNR